MNCLGLLSLLIIALINRFINMYHHIIVYTLLNRPVHTVIDDITGPIARAGSAEVAPPAHDANQIPLGGLIEWI